MPQCLIAGDANVLPPPVTAKTTNSIVIIPGDHPEEGMMVVKGKTLRKVLRRQWKIPRQRSTSGPGSEHDDGEELGDHNGSKWTRLPTFDSDLESFSCGRSSTR